MDLHPLQVQESPIPNFAAWFLFAANEGTLPTNTSDLITDYLPQPFAAVSQSTLNQWIELHGSIVASPDSVNPTETITVEFPLDPTTGDGFVGVMYVDDIQISPP